MANSIFTTKNVWKCFDSAPSQAHIASRFDGNSSVGMTTQKGSMKKKLKQAHGNWVEGDKFWGGEKEIELLTGKIDEGAHILLVAQRRMGKTSLMHEIARRLTKAERYICLYIDLQGAASAEDAIVKLSLSTRPHASLWGKTKAVFANALGTIKDTIDSINLGEVGVKLRAGLTAGDWRAKGDQLFDVLAVVDKPVLLLLDEVPILINRILKGDDFTITPERRKNADAFLSWLRENCLKHQHRVHLILSGSIGLEPILRQGQLSATINHYAPFELKPWDPETATGCLNALASEYKILLGDGVTEAVIKQLGYCIPHHIQMFFSRIQETCVRERKQKISADEIEHIYQEGMLGIAGHAELTHYEERLKLVLGEDDFTLALDMLTETAVTGVLRGDGMEQLRRDAGARLQTQGITRDLVMAQKDILWVLEHDGYLRKTDQGYVFVSNLLHDWWNARHGGLFYTPTAKRIKTKTLSP
jgi:hypothetical protein